MTTTAMQMPQRSLLERINVRMIVFVLIIAAPFMWFGYVFLDQVMTGGIENKGDYYKVDLKAMGNFPFDTASGSLTEVPERWRQLDGKRVQLEGYMVSSSSAGVHAHDFQLVYNVRICCFSGPPMVQERVFGRISNKQLTLYDSNVMVKMMGTLHVKPLKEEGSTTSIYTMDVDQVEPS